MKRIPDWLLNDTLGPLPAGIDLSGPRTLTGEIVRLDDPSAPPTWLIWVREVETGRLWPLFDREGDWSGWPCGLRLPFCPGAEIVHISRY